jgi:hypothetical protein
MFKTFFERSIKMKGPDYTLCLLFAKLDINTKSKKKGESRLEKNTTF